MFDGVRVLRPILKALPFLSLGSIGPCRQVSERTRTVRAHIHLVERTFGDRAHDRIGSIGRTGPSEFASSVCEEGHLN